MESMLQLDKLYLLFSLMLIVFALGGCLFKDSVDVMGNIEDWMQALSLIIFNKHYTNLTEEEEIELALFRTCMLPDTVREAVEIMPTTLEDFVFAQWDEWHLK